MCYLLRKIEYRLNSRHPLLLFTVEQRKTHWKRGSRWGYSIDNCRLLPGKSLGHSSKLLSDSHIKCNIFSQNHHGIVSAENP